MFARTRDTAVNNPADPARWLSALSTTGTERLGGDVDRGFRLAIEDVPNAVLISGESGGVLVANRAAERLFGYAQGQMVGQPLERLMPGWSPRVKAEPWRRRPVAGVRSDGGVVPLDVDIAPVLDGPVRYVVTYIGGVNGGLKTGAGPAEAAGGIAGIHRVIADMATRFVTIEPHSVDDRIGESLREIAKVLRLDRAILWRRVPADATTGPSDYAIGHPESSHHELLLELASVQFIASKLEANEIASFMQLGEVPESGRSRRVPEARPSIRSCRSRCGTRSRRADCSLFRLHHGA